jgi:hypothetical protein
VSVLSDEQRNRSLEVMQEYLAATTGDGKSLTEVEAELDQRRVSVIEGELAPLLSVFLTGGVPLAEFRSKIDSVNKRHEYWGFRGVNGQMFYNMLVNVADDLFECEERSDAEI